MEVSWGFSKGFERSKVARQGCLTPSQTPVFGGRSGCALNRAQGGLAGRGSDTGAPCVSVFPSQLCLGASCVWVGTRVLDYVERLMWHPFGTPHPVAPLILWHLW
jgi:hypothetical protein